MTDIVIRLKKTAEDLATTEGYGGYVRMLIEAAAEISQLRAIVRQRIVVNRMKNKQKEKVHGTRS